MGQEGFGTGQGVWVGRGCKRSTSPFKIPMWHSKLANPFLNTSRGRHAALSCLKCRAPYARLGRGRKGSGSYWRWVLVGDTQGTSLSQGLVWRLDVGAHISWQSAAKLIGSSAVQPFPDHRPSESLWSKSIYSSAISLMGLWCVISAANTGYYPLYSANTGPACLRNVCKCFAKDYGKSKSADSCNGTQSGPERYF